MWGKLVLVLLLINLFTSEVNCECDSVEKTTPATPPTTTTTPTTTPEPTTITPPYPLLGGNCTITVENLNLKNPAPADACEEGWTAFRRQKGIRCLKTFSAVTTQPMAQTNCEKENGTLAGLENNQERSWLHSQFIHLASSSNQVHSVWIGALRKPECRRIRDFPDDCYPKEKNMFYWSDDSVTGNDMFCQWWLTAPDNAVDTQLQNCIHFAIMATTEPVEKWRITQGSLDDIHCNIGYPFIIGYVCSKKPEH